VLLLDTQAWIWTVEGDRRRVGRQSRRLIEKAAALEAVRGSAVTIFEVVALHAAGRLRLSMSAERWIEMALERPGVRLAELTADVAVDAGFIPRTALADPLDRLLTATARHLDATFFTADSAILDYAKVTSNLRVHNLSR